MSDLMWITVGLAADVVMWRLGWVQLAWRIVRGHR